MSSVSSSTPPTPRPHAEAQQKIRTIQAAVAGWSRANFGNQESKAVPGLVLGSMAALMGLAEEAGELDAAHSSIEYRDALGDMGVYLCDYAAREGVALADYYPDSKDGVFVLADHAPNEGDSFTEALGRLFHCTLKRHQGIRGFLDSAKYADYRDKAIRDLLRLLVGECMEEGFDFLDNLQTTWDEVVKKRNWKTNPEDAHKPEVFKTPPTVNDNSQFNNE